jgi:hypothetical protein
MSQQPVSGNQYYVVGTVGTNVVSNQPATLIRVVIPGTYVGSVALQDASSTAGTTATSKVLTFGLPATAIPSSVEIGVQFKKGIVAEQTGTPSLVLVWDK